LAYKSHINRIFSLIPYACEVFSCTEEEFFAIFDRLNVADPAAPLPRRKRGGEAAAEGEEVAAKGDEADLGLQKRRRRAGGSEKDPDPNPSPRTPNPEKDGVQ